jgi:hypothetical protein
MEHIGDLLGLKKMPREEAQISLELEAANQELFRISEKRLAVEKGITDEKNKQLGTDFGGSGFVLQRKPMGLSERLGAGANRQIGLANLAAPLPFSFKGAKQESSEFSQHMKSGFMSATGTLTQGFVQAFHLANNLAGQLLATLIAAASQALIIMGLRAVGDYISPGLGTSLFGEGGSGKGSAAPSGSPTPISAQRSGGAGSASPFVTVVPIIDNAGLAVRVEVGNRINSRRRS